MKIFKRNKSTDSILPEGIFVNGDVGRGKELGIVEVSKFLLNNKIDSFGFGYHSYLIRNKIQKPSIDSWNKYQEYSRLSSIDKFLWKLKQLFH